MTAFRRAIAFASLLILTLGFSGCSLFGSDDDDQLPPAELTKFEATVKPRRLWSHKLGKTDEELRLGLAIATDGSRVFGASQAGRVTAIDAFTGKVVWRTDTDLPLAAGPAYGSSMVLVGSSDGDVVALDAESGEQRWKVAVSSEVLASPAVSLSLAIVRTVDGKIRGLELDSGAERWLFEEQVPRLTLRGNSPPAVSGDLVVSGFDDGKVVGVTLSDGLPAWQAQLGGQRGRTELERLADIDGGIRIVGEDVYAAGFQSRIAMLAIESGQLLWSRDLSTARTPGVDWGKVYVSEASGEIIALDRNTGVPAWQQGALARRDLTGPVPYGREVVVGDFEGYLHWLNVENGSIVGRIRAGRTAIAADPLVVGENVYVLTASGALVAVRASAE